MLSGMRGGAAFAAVVGLALGMGACAADETSSQGSAVSCMPGQPQVCSCAGTAVGMQVCGMDGASFSQCMCGPGTPTAGAGGSGAAGTAGGGAGTAGSAAGAGGFMAAGTGGAGLGGRGGQGGAGGMSMTGTGGSSGAGGAGGMSSGGAGGAAGGTGGASAPAMDMDGLRQACVDYINMYRATLGRPPYRRGTPEQETCSDEGAMKDGDSGQAHSSAGDCPGLGAQNSCPGYPVRGDGVAAIETSLKGCLDQMWDEGMPPIPITDCIRDSSGCFQQHGHWINMQSESSQVVACGFYKMANGRYWMNQNFGR